MVRWLVFLESVLVVGASFCFQWSSTIVLSLAFEGGNLPLCTPRDVNLEMSRRGCLFVSVYEQASYSMTD
jgi:hypothetical protein